MEMLYYWMPIKSLCFYYGLYAVWYWSTVEIKETLSFKCIRVGTFLKYFSLFNLFIIEKKKHIKK